MCNFCLQEHYNLVADDPLLGPALLSVKNELMAGQEHTRLVLRLKSGTQHELLPNSCIQQAPSPAKLAKVRNTKLYLALSIGVCLTEVKIIVLEENSDNSLRFYMNA